MGKFTCNFISYALKRTVDINVIVPTPTIPESMGMGLAEGESAKHTPKAPYPVLYLLHGFGNNFATWSGYTKVELYAEEHQIIVVNMSAENKFYVTKEGGDDFFKFISEELPDFVTGLFPASKRPEDTYIAGLSMGGMGTLIHGLSNPEKYCAMGVLSAGGNKLVDFTNPSNKLMADDLWPEEQIKNWPEGKKFPKIYMACGTEDGVMKSAPATRDQLIAKGADVTWDQIEGYGHEWRFWDIEIEKFLKWIPRTDIYAGKTRQV